MSDLVSGFCHAGCEAVVIVPVRDEEERLGRCLAALYTQTVYRRRYEVILLLNNCRDASAAIARRFQFLHRDLSLHPVSITLNGEQASVGFARRLLMNEACRRLSGQGAILSTDGDTEPARDWVEANLNCLNSGADAVGGLVELDPQEYGKLPLRARREYDRDAAYQTACARLETLLDGDPRDPWPRHHHNFGASLGCSAAIYRQVGGLPNVDCLEDVEFVNRLRRADAVLRHSPSVKVRTAARISGRARIGLSSQLREWEAEEGERLVDSAVFLRHYFTCRAVLRALWNTGSGDISRAAWPLQLTPSELERQLAASSTFGQLHDALDLRGTLWRNMAPDRRVLPLNLAIPDLEAAIAAAAHPAGNAPRALRAGAANVEGSEKGHAPRLPSLGNPQQTA